MWSQQQQYILILKKRIWRRADESATLIVYDFFLVFWLSSWDHSSVLEANTAKLYRWSFGASSSPSGVCEITTHLQTEFAVGVCNNSFDGLIQITLHSQTYLYCFEALFRWANKKINSLRIRRAKTPKMFRLLYWLRSTLMSANIHNLLFPFRFQCNHLWYWSRQLRCVGKRWDVWKLSENFPMWAFAQSNKTFFLFLVEIDSLRLSQKWKGSLDNEVESLQIDGFN